MSHIGSFKTVLLLSYISIASVSAVMITPALPHIQTLFGLSNGSLEWIVSIFMIGYVVGQLIYGPLANRFGRLAALRAGLLINLVGIGLCVIASSLVNYQLLLLGRLVTALGAASGLSCTFMLLNELLDQDKAKHVMSFSILSFTVGIGVAVVLGGLVTQYGQWQDCFWILGAHGLLMLLLTWQFPETLQQPQALHPAAILKGYAGALQSSTLIIFSLVVGICSAFSYCYAAAAPIFAQQVLHVSPAEYGYWNLVNMVGMLGSGFLGAHIMKRYGPKKLLQLGLGCMAPCLVSLMLIAFTHSQSAVWFFATTMGLYLFSGILFPAGSYFASNAIACKAGASSMMSFINMGSATLAVMIMGYLPLSSIAGFAAVIVVFFVVVLLSSLCNNGKILG